jgi:hypothetical protein
MRQLSPRSPTRLANTACAYCHTPFTPDAPAEEEHVIGRRFVPKDSLRAQWNLIVRSCRACNEAKSGLEGDISAITMRPDPWGRVPADQRALEEARRKGSARSRRTGKAVRDSAERFTIRSQIMPGVELSADFVAGPQVDPDRARRLAYFHVAAFFYLITYDRGKGCGASPPGVFTPVAQAARPDWGNAHLRAIQESTAGWHWRVHGIGADEYFKIVIRRHPDQHLALWMWALEWNQGYRIAGFFGAPPAIRPEIDRLPSLGRRCIERTVDPDAGPCETWVRDEVPLAQEDDRLFAPPPGD